MTMPNGHGGLYPSRPGPTSRCTAIGCGWYSLRTGRLVACSNHAGGTLFILSQTFSILPDYASWQRLTTGSLLGLDSRILFRLSQPFSPDSGRVGKAASALVATDRDGCRGNRADEIEVSRGQAGQGTGPEPRPAGRGVEGVAVPAREATPGSLALCCRGQQSAQFLAG